MKLGSDRRERENIEECSDFYAIIKTTDLLEAAFAKGAISADDYTTEVSKLISSFEMQERALIAGRVITSAEAFMAEHGITAVRARLRLLQDKVPATAKHITSTHGADMAAVIDTTTLFITVMDALKLGMLAKDQLYPEVKALQASLQKHVVLPPEHGAKVPINHWMSVLQGKAAADVLDDAAARQMSLDMDEAYGAFRDHFELAKR